jgi:hypothetical protein
MDEYQIEICKRLLDIGIQEDYYQHVNAELLEDVSNLPLLHKHERNILFDEVVNLNLGFGFLQDKTNVLLRNLIGRIGELKLPNDL